MSRPLDLDALRELATKATQGPWVWHWRTDDKDSPGCVHSEHDSPSRPVAVFMCPRYGKTHFEHDAAYVVAVQPREVMKLIDRVAALERERDALAAVLRKIEPWSHVLSAPPGYETTIRPFKDEVASMTPTASTIPSLKHADDCPGCTARETLTGGGRSAREDAP